MPSIQVILQVPLLRRRFRSPDWMCRQNLHLRNRWVALSVRCLWCCNQSTQALLPYICLLFSGFSNVCHCDIFWPLTYVWLTNFSFLFFRPLQSVQPSSQLCLKSRLITTTQQHQCLHHPSQHTANRHHTTLHPANQQPAWLSPLGPTHHPRHCTNPRLPTLVQCQHRHCTNPSLPTLVQCHHLHHCTNLRLSLVQCHHLPREPICSLHRYKVPHRWTCIIQLDNLYQAMGPQGLLVYPSQGLHLLDPHLLHPLHQGPHLQQVMVLQVWL